MPMAIPLIMAAASMAEGATVVGALAALGGGVGMGSAILGGMVLAGSAMSTLGFITGNQKLSKYGGMVGLVGGVGAIANGAMNAATAKVATQAAIPSTDTALANTPVANGIEQGAGATSGSAGSLGQTGLSSGYEGVGGAGTYSGSGVADAGAQAGASDLTGLSSGYEGVGGNGTYNTDLPSGYEGVGGGFDKPDLAGLQSGYEGVGGSSTYNEGLIGRGLPTTSGPVKDLVPGSTGASSPWDKIKQGASDLGKWTKDNKELANLGGGLIKGGMESYSQDRNLRKRFEMEREQDDQRRARFNESVRGLRMPTYQPPVRKA